MKSKAKTAVHRTNLSERQQALLRRRLSGERTGNDDSTIRRSNNIAGNSPLSFSQQGLWLLDQVQKRTTSCYNISIALKLTGRLNIEALHQAFTEIARRHSILRTVFDIENGTPVQIVKPQSRQLLHIVDVADKAISTRAALVQHLSFQESRYRFDLARGPLFRVTLAQLSKTQHILFLNVHHIVADGWSMGILIREALALYTSFTKGIPSPLSDLSIQYADFARWQHDYLTEKKLEPHLEYWCHQLKGCPPSVDIASADKRRAGQSAVGSRLTFNIPSALVLDLTAFIQKSHNTTLFMVLLAAFKLLLHRYTGQRDLCIGTRIAGRNRIETEQLIGLFINVLPIRTQIDASVSFNEYLEVVRKVTLEAYDHREVPFNLIIKAVSSIQPIAQQAFPNVMFVLQNLPIPELTAEGIAFERVEEHSGTTKYDLDLTINEDKDSLIGVFEYNVDIFDSATIQNLADDYLYLLNSIVENPLTVLSAYPLQRDLPHTVVRSDVTDDTDEGFSEASHGVPGKSAFSDRKIEEIVMGVWKEVLQLDTVGLDDNFFEIGGHSMLMTLVHTRLQEELKTEIPITNLFEYPTIRTIVQDLSPTQPNSRQIATIRETSEQGDIAVVSMAGRFPGADSIDEFWSNLCEGKESVTFFSTDDLAESFISPDLINAPNYIRACPIIENIEWFDHDLFGMTRSEAELLDPQQRLFLECAWEALEKAGYDTQRYDGLIGVFGGTKSSTYAMNNIFTNSALVQTLDPLQISIAHDKDYLATRTSYKLNLKGPSVTVQTACSTSLVAVHMACESLRDGKCDMALAGGVSITVPSKNGYVYQEGGILSPDGHCRTFDAKAQGTIFGNGIGIVTLKRLSDALADGDNVIAVVKGSAINNDGSLKVNYTAPSIEGQATVVSDAHKAAGVDPETISYVEAHGTATALGDSVEVAALSKAFNQNIGQCQYCAIGSVKTNIGHLETASGIAGLIKTVLCVYHKQLPPNLHFETPNPKIDFKNSPFFVNAHLTDWTSNRGMPLRAGVSSFGMGGTNAHAILEEAPPIQDSGDSRPYQLLTLSAKSASALQIMSENLMAHLVKTPDANLADIAYTLQNGRRAFAHRRALVCNSVDDARTLLENMDTHACVTSNAKSENRPVAFMFSGQGAQYAGAATVLYEYEPVFRETIDNCANLFENRLQFDLRECLYSAPVGTRERDGRLQQTIVAQPVLFSIEYALARLWMAWGVRPEVLIGHSIGEYAAACVAGVFSLEDAVTLVSERSKLMQECPNGAMLAVFLSPHELDPYLNETISLAAHNSPSMCVVSGDTDAIDNFESLLSANAIDSRRLHVSHAFHSNIMDLISDEFHNVAKQVAFRSPQIPYLSNITGTWITPEEVTDPAYWSRHLRQPVLFSEGIQTLLKGRSWSFLEVGPGHTLCTFVRQHFADRSGHIVAPSLPHPQNPSSDFKTLLHTLSRLWADGLEIDWASFSKYEQRRRVELPTYPFERTRCWIDRNPHSTTIPGDKRDPVNVTRIDHAVHHSSNHGMTAISQHTIQADPKASAIELRLINIWKHVLGADEIDIHDDFFELGGHSLLATQLMDLVRKEFSIDLPLRSFFEAPAISKMAKLVEDRLQAPPDRSSIQLTPITPDDDHRYESFPLTDVQQAYWIGRSGLYDMGNVATHLYMEIEGSDISLNRFSKALNRLISHHDMLRAVITSEGEQQILDKTPTYEIEVLNFREMIGEDKNRAIAEIRQRMSHQVLPSDQWPLFEVKATQFDHALTRLHISFDLMIADAWSGRMIAQELCRLYENPETSLPTLNLSFRDYVLAEKRLHETEQYQRALDYWRQRLESLSPAPDLPLAMKPSELTHPRFVRYDSKLETDAWARLKKRIAQLGLTPSVVLLTAYAEVLSRWCKNPKFTLNLTLFNRLPFHSQVNEIVGDFTSIVLVEADTTKLISFEKRARLLQEQLWSALDHRHVSGIQVLRELARKQNSNVKPTMPVVFTSTLNLEATDHASLTSGVLGEVVYSISQTPQVWLDHQVGEYQGELVFNWDVVDGLFPPGMISDMFASYCDLVNRLANDNDFWSTSYRDLLPLSQRKQRDVCNQTTVPVPEGLLQDRFFDQAAQQPDRPAVITSGRTLSYGEVARQATKLGRLLQDVGAQRNTLIGVVMEKGWEQIVSVLGILQSGAAYLPIDPALPKESVWYLLEFGRVDIAITQPEIEAAMEWPSNITRICLEDERLEGIDVTDLVPPEKPDDIAYVIFTSGSTGTPKGVTIDHRGALNTVCDINDRFQIGPTDRVLSLSALNFDLSVYDIFGLLSVGGAVVIPDATSIKDPAHWLSLIESEKVTIWNTVPTLMRLLVEYSLNSSRRVSASLRLVMMSGDWIPVSLPDQIRDLVTSVEVVSLGGATEASIWSIIYPIGEVGKDWSSIPYGLPMKNQTFHVLSNHLEPCPVLVPGKLYIGGIGLAKRYWRDGEKTKERFITHPETGMRLYMTGDLGRYLPDGNIEFLGREDFQVKIQGYRIELGEIEAALCQHPDVQTAAVIAIGEMRGEKKLAAYVVAERGRVLTSAMLRTFLSRKIAKYKIPNSIAFLESLPLTANGKVDRSALPLPESTLTESTNTEKAGFSIPSNIKQLLAAAVKTDDQDAMGEVLKYVDQFSQEEVETMLKKRTEETSTETTARPSM